MNRKCAAWIPRCATSYRALLVEISGFQTRHQYAVAYVSFCAAYAATEDSLSRSEVFRGDRPPGSQPSGMSKSQFYGFSAERRKLYQNLALGFKCLAAISGARWSSRKSEGQTTCRTRHRSRHVHYHIRRASCVHIRRRSRSRRREGRTICGPRTDPLESP